MTAVDRVAGGRVHSHPSQRAVRFLTVAAVGLATLTASTGQFAHQDMTSLRGGSKEANRWQPSFVPSSAETADIADTDSGKTPRLSAESGVRPGNGALFTAPNRPSALGTPDEMRVARAEKGRRVLSLTPASKLPPRGFSAGSILERQSLLGSRVTGGQERIRTAFSKVTQSSKDAMTLAMNFQLKGPPSILPGQETTTNDRLMLASLKPSDAATGALGYAPSGPQTGSRTSSLFEKILKDTPQAFIPPIGEKDPAWAATPLPAVAYTDKEQKCLANGLYFEARGESTLGQAAVGQVILNRVRNPAYPNTICGVVYQNKSWRNRCQFSFACDGVRDRVTDRGAWARVKRVAELVTKGDIWINAVGSATNYHANYVRPRWASAMEKVDQIGKHIFYRALKAVGR